MKETMLRILKNAKNEKEKGLIIDFFITLTELNFLYTNITQYHGKITEFENTWLPCKFNLDLPIEERKKQRNDLFQSHFLPNFMVLPTTINIYIKSLGTLENKITNVLKKREKLAIKNPKQGNNILLRMTSFFKKYKPYAKDIRNSLLTHDQNNKNLLFFSNWFRKNSLLKNRNTVEHRLNQYAVKYTEFFLSKNVFKKTSVFLKKTKEIKSKISEIKKTQDQISLLLENLEEYYI